MIGAQFFLALQLITEENFLSKFEAHPLQIVGYEGIYGMIILCSLLFSFRLALEIRKLLGICLMSNLD